MIENSLPYNGRVTKALSRPAELSAQLMRSVQLCNLCRKLHSLDYIL